MIGKRYGQSTVGVYISCLHYFHKHFKGNVNTLSKKEIQNYQYHLVIRGYSRSTQNQHINAIKYYYEKFLERDKEFYFIERPIKEKKIPIVLSKSEIQSLIANTYNLKHRSILAVIYSGG